MKRKRPTTNKRRGDALRDAREAAGLSLRDLAARAGISWVGIANAEKGVDVRHDTLRKLLKALPELTPRDLLPTGPRTVRMSRADAWEYYRDLVGHVADEVERVDVVRVDETADAPPGAVGTREQRFQCRGFRSLWEAESDVRLLHGLERRVHARAPTALRELLVSAADSKDDDEVRARVVEHDDGLFLHRFSIPSKLARQGLTYGWTRLSTDVALTRAESARQYGFSPEDPVHDGLSYAPTYAVRQLKLRVHFPAGHWPRLAYVKVWPESMYEDADMEDVTRLVHPEGLALRRDRRRRTISCRIVQPLMGLRYALGWEQP